MDLGPRRRGTHGTNCTGNCAFNVYVKDGIVWREEQQGEYGASGDDVPDYGPRGCQKGLRHAKYMYGNQRLLYPMKRAGERGEGKWERVSWDQALTEIADKFIDYSVEFGPVVNYDRVGHTSRHEANRLRDDRALRSDYRSRVPGSLCRRRRFADRRLYDHRRSVALRYHGGRLQVEVLPDLVLQPGRDAHTRRTFFLGGPLQRHRESSQSSPEFTPTAMHASKWLNPNPGTDAALAMSMVQVILDEGIHDAAFIREQTDMPYLVRTDNGKFLRETDMLGGAEARDNLFYIWDEETAAAVPAPGTGSQQPPPGSPEPVHNVGSLALG